MAQETLKTWAVWPDMQRRCQHVDGKTGQHCQKQSKFVNFCEEHYKLDIKVNKKLYRVVVKRSGAGVRDSGYGLFVQQKEGFRIGETIATFSGNTWPVHLFKGGDEVRILS